jgi:hypothetical protein
MSESDILFGYNVASLERARLEEEKEFDALVFEVMDDRKLMKKEHKIEKDI